MKFPGQIKYYIKTYRVIDNPVDNISNFKF